MNETIKEKRDKEYWKFEIGKRRILATRKAAEEFKGEEESRCLTNADVILNRLKELVTEVNRGMPTQPISYFIRNELITLLSTKTWTECRVLALKEDLPPEAYETDDINAVAEYMWVEVWTKEYKLWREIVTTFEAYLHGAAALAKAYDSMDSARKFILVWRRIKKLCSEFYTYMAQEEAALTMREANEAAELFIADILLEDLEPLDLSIIPFDPEDQ